MGNSEYQNINSKDFIIGTLIGGIVGVSAALLFTPKSGKELRGDINVGASQIKDRANDWKDVAYEKGSTLKDKAYEKGSEVKDMATDSASQLTKNVSQKTQDLTKSVQNKLQDKRSKEDEALKAAEEVAEAIDEAADAIDKK